MARRLFLPPMRRRWKLGGNEGTVDLSSMSLSRFCDGRDDFSGHAKAVADVVPGGLACYQPEKRCQRGKPAASARLGELYDGVDMAAQTASSHGCLLYTSQSPRDGLL